MTPAKKDRFDKKLRINIGREENDDNYFDNEHWEQRGALLLRGEKPDGLHGDDIRLRRTHPLLDNFPIEYKRNKAKNISNFFILAKISFIFFQIVLVSLFYIFALLIFP